MDYFGVEFGGRYFRLMCSTIKVKVAITDCLYCVYTVVNLDLKKSF